VARLRASGWIAPHTTVVAETGAGDALPALGTLLSERVHGMARVSIWREAE
jgi:sugar/nucleoside kinase (ribokinase family)